MWISGQYSQDAGQSLAIAVPAPLPGNCLSRLPLEVLYQILGNLSSQEIMRLAARQIVFCVIV